MLCIHIHGVRFFGGARAERKEEGGGTEEEEEEVEGGRRGHSYLRFGRVGHNKFTTVLSMVNASVDENVLAVSHFYPGKASGACGALVTGVRVCTKFASHPHFKNYFSCSCINSVSAPVGYF